MFGQEFKTQILMENTVLWLFWCMVIQKTLCFVICLWRIKNALTDHKKKLFKSLYWEVSLLTNILLWIKNRDAKTYQCANNVDVTKSYLGKNLCQISRCFVEKVSNVAILRFVAKTSVYFLLLYGIFYNFMLLFGLVCTFLVF